MKIKWNSHDVNLTVWTVKRKSDGKYLQYGKYGDIEYIDTPSKFHMTLDQVKKQMTNKYMAYWSEPSGVINYKIHDPQLNVDDFEFTECGADDWVYMTVKNKMYLPTHRYDIVGE